jgi:cell division transport system permease protein
LMVDKLRSQAALEVYLKVDIDSLSREKLQDNLIANQYILKVNHITKDMALYRLRDTFGAEMVRGLSSNPLPESYELTLEPAVYEGNAYQGLVDSLKKIPGVDDVGYVPGVIKRLKMIFRVVSILGLVLGALVILACGFIVGNTIGVAVAGRHLTFYVMRLVGAKSAFVRAPYLMMGFLIGIIGVCLAVFALKIGAENFSRFVIPLIFLENVETISFIIGGGLIGLLGSHLALKKYMEI